MKRCSKCGESKTPTEFSPSRITKDGFHAYCKSCMNTLCRTKYRKQRRKSNRRFWIRPENAEAHRLAAAFQRLLNPEQSRAHWKVRQAIRSGKLKRQPCMICNDSKSHAHHENYAKPLEVMWLCQSHHKQHHLKQNNAGLPPREPQHHEHINKEGITE